MSYYQVSHRGHPVAIIKNDRPGANDRVVSASWVLRDREGRKRRGYPFQHQVTPKHVRTRAPGQDNIEICEIAHYKDRSEGAVAETEQIALNPVKCGQQARAFIVAGDPREEGSHAWSK